MKRKAKNIWKGNNSNGMNKLNKQRQQR